MNGEIDAFIVKMFCRIQNGRTYQICMQDKLHAGQYSLFPSLRPRGGEGLDEAREAHVDDVDNDDDNDGVWDN